MAHSSANSVLQRELLDTIKGLRATVESLQSTIEDLRKSLAESQERERLAKEQIEVMTKRFFGRSSEKHMVQSDGQLDFFNEIELEADRQTEEFPYETAKHPLYLIDEVDNQELLRDIILDTYEDLKKK